MDNSLETFTTPEGYTAYIASAHGIGIDGLFLGVSKGLIHVLAQNQERMVYFLQDHLTIKRKHPQLKDHDFLFIPIKNLGQGMGYEEAIRLLLNHSGVLSDVVAEEYAKG
jgi:hypothetical protein